VIETVGPLLAGGVCVLAGRGGGRRPPPLIMHVARQFGHNARLTLTTYGHVIDEFEDQPRIPAEDAIRAARESSCACGVHADRPDEQAS
jgi:hypothetical protein